MDKQIELLFILFIVFISLNAFCYSCIYYYNRERLYKKLLIYWIVVFVVFLVEGTVREGVLALSLIFVFNLFPILIFTSILVESFDVKLDYKKYAFFTILAIVLSVLFNYLGFGFRVVSAPIVYITCIPSIQAIYVTLVRNRAQSDFIQRFMAFMVGMPAIVCCLNYGLNRYNADATTTLIGFGSGFLTYLVASILLPVFTVREIAKEQRKKLEFLVIERTEELEISKKQKENLIRVLVHDISNSLQSIMLQNTRLSLVENQKSREISSQIDQYVENIIQVTRHVKLLEKSRSGVVELSPINVNECVMDIKSLFDERYKEKNVALKIKNNLTEVTFISIDKTAFVNSVLANLISNALKFSYEGGEVLFSIYKTSKDVYFNIEDQGTGIDISFLKKIFERDINFSLPGTNGEVGTGFGLPLVKSYSQMFGGDVEIFSNSEGELTGTRVVVNVPLYELDEDIVELGSV